jgi:hypothetical protein
MPEPSTNNKAAAEADIEINLSRVGQFNLHSIRRLLELLDLHFLSNLLNI